MLIFVIFFICCIFALIFVVGLDVINNYIATRKIQEITVEERLVDLSLDISDQIFYFQMKHGISDDDLCKKLKITKDTLSVWFSGIYDFKLSQLARLEALFNEYLIKTTLIDRKKIKSQ